MEQHRVGTIPIALLNGKFFFPLDAVREVR